MTDDKLNWDDLRYFSRAAQAGTLAGAARALEVEHSTVGRRLSALERALGAALVVRGPDGLHLTQLGERLTPLVAEVERKVAAVRELAAAESARVRIALPSGFTSLFADRLNDWLRQHPGLALELLSGAQRVDLERGEADLALRSGPVRGQALVSRKLCDTGFSLYASHAYVARRAAPINLEDLSGHDVIAFDRSLHGMPAATWLEARLGSATVVLRSREMTDILAAAVSGLGIAVMPCMLGDVAPELTRLTPEVVASRSLSLVYRPEARLSQNVRLVMRFVEGTLKANATRISGIAR